MQIIYLNPGKRSEGDVKILKSGKRFLRRYVRVYNTAGQCIGREVTRNGPCYEWVREERT